MKFFKYSASKQKSLNTEKIREEFFFIAVHSWIILLKKLSKTNEKETQRFLKNLYSRLEKLDNIYQGKVITKFERIKIPILIEQVLSEIKEIEDTKFMEIETEIHHNIVVISDFEILKIILLELIMNAIWACKGQGKVSISIGKEDEKYSFIKISDTGIGIPSRIMEHIFYPFFQGEERFIKKGTGLGLSIVKGLLKYIGGKIEIKSEFQKGTGAKIYLKGQ